MEPFPPSPDLIFIITLSIYIYLNLIRLIKCVQIVYEPIYIKYKIICSKLLINLLKDLKKLLEINFELKISQFLA